jgi:hypothetical protein
MKGNFWSCAHACVAKVLGDINKTAQPDSGLLYESSVRRVLTPRSASPGPGHVGPALSRGVAWHPGVSVVGRAP